MTAKQTPGFDVRASRYEELRPVDDNWWEVYDALVRIGELRGARVLEVGCGTGRLSAALVEREHARVWALDVSGAMVERANANGVHAKVGRAETLPFKEGWFDAVVMRMVIHLIDRPRAFAQAARVLAPGGRLAIATENPASFDDVWFARFFPSVPEIERGRFPSSEALRAELETAGFGSIEIEELRQQRTISRDQALDIIRSKAFSTFDLLDPREYDHGLARAEADLPEQLSYRFDWLLCAARR
jgi:ubiquinone/menaquinone biosynthesis C-methylase UbiE